MSTNEFLFVSICVYSWIIFSLEREFDASGKDGLPAAPDETRLWLLPSGPDQVHGPPVHRARPCSRRRNRTLPEHPARRHRVHHLVRCRESKRSFPSSPPGAAPYVSSPTGREALETEAGPSLLPWRPGMPRPCPLLRSKIERIGAFFARRSQAARAGNSVSIRRQPAIRHVHALPADREMPQQGEWHCPPHMSPDVRLGLHAAEDLSAAGDELHFVVVGSKGEADGTLQGSETEAAAGGDGAEAGDSAGTQAALGVRLDPTAPPVHSLIALSKSHPKMAKIASPKSNSRSTATTSFGSAFSPRTQLR
jgi:hypothetical protein